MSFFVMDSDELARAVAYWLHHVRGVDELAGEVEFRDAKCRALKITANVQLKDPSYVPNPEKSS